MPKWSKFSNKFYCHLVIQNLGLNVNLMLNLFDNNKPLIYNVFLILEIII